MCSIKLSFIIIIILLTSWSEARPQAGMKFQEFSKKLEYYFDSDMISDLEKKMPQGSSYAIWGWDVGDFSGDGINDVAFAVKVTSDKKKVVQVYQFVDIDGYLSLVEQLPFDFVELPLEVGVVIRSNICYITQKHKQFDWTIKGYRLKDGNLFMVDDFHTKRIDKYTNESYINYQSLTGTEKYQLLTNNKTSLKAKYLSVPCYKRGRTIYSGYSEQAESNDVDFVIAGAWYWKGFADASYSIKSAYDNENLYLTLNVIDDIFIPMNCDSCFGDYFELWFDLSQSALDANRFAKVSGEHVQFRTEEGKELYNLKVFPGDFLDKRAFISEVSSTQDLESYQKDAIKNIKLSSSPRDNGYTIKLKIPFLLFGFEGAPVDKNSFTRIGFTAVYHDIDNEYRPEEESQIATSVFERLKPETYGEIIFVPQDKWFGQSENIYTIDIKRYLMELGF